MANTPTILVIEPKRENRAFVHAAVSQYGRVESFDSFASARARVVAGSFDYLVTNLRLEAFNGLHLVYLSRSLGIAARTIVYSEVHDASLVGEADAAGAAYCDLKHVHRSLADYLHPESAPHRSSRTPRSHRATRPIHHSYLH